ncbi:MAG: dTMP kinase [bacterium]
MLITFEGPEGCGKSTQSKILKTFLEGKGKKVLLTQEPGGTPLGKELRKMLLQPDNVLDNTTEIYLFAADRSEHVSKIILPALAEGQIVICDRYIDSTIAYQIGGRGLPEDLVRYVNMISSKGLLPDLTILLDVSPEIGLKRAAGKGAADRFEGEKIAFHQKVRAKYLEIAKENKARIKVINTDAASIEEVQNKIRSYLNEK